MNLDSFDSELVESVSFLPDLLSPPNAWVGHIPFAAWVIKQVKPAVFVELGTHSGNSYFSFCQSVKDTGLATKCYAVDTWVGDEHAGYYDNDVFNVVNAHNQKNYENFSHLMRMSFDDAKEYFPDGTVELLHIDGLHTYDAVKHDFETWLPKLAPNALVLFHDTTVRKRGFGVWKFWEELTQKYPYNLEFTHSHGLGVLLLGTKSDQSKYKWLNANSPSKTNVQKLFSALGKKLLDHFELLQGKENISQLNDLILAEKNNAVAQIEYRDSLIKELEERVAAEKNNAVAQIEYRDSLIKELEEKMSAEKQEAATQIESRDRQVKDLRRILSSRRRLLKLLILPDKKDNT